MARGTVYDSERAVTRDRRSGLRIYRLTHSPCISMNLYFEMCSFTEDEEYVVLLSQRYAGRDAPFDLFRAKTDGAELVQLTESDHIAGLVVSPKTNCAYYHSGEDLRRIDLLSLQEDSIARIPGDKPVGPHSLATIDGRGRFYFSNCLDSKGVATVFRVDVGSGETLSLFQSESQNHLHVDPTGTTLAFNDLAEKQFRPLLIDTDGGNLRGYEFDRFAHCTWFAETGKMQGCLLPPGQAIVTYREGDREPSVLSQGRYYWHSSPSRDAKWIVADTNWPREGIYLLHVPTGTTNYVCDPQSSCSHPQWTHPHPSVSPGMRYVLFNSDLTGIGQAYLVELTDEFLDKASTGHDCRPVPMG